jgi:hypothetical protein
MLICINHNVVLFGSNYDQKTAHDFLLPQRHIPYVKPTKVPKAIISPVNGVLFASTNSMQNWQIGKGTDGAARYIEKYICKWNLGDLFSLRIRMKSSFLTSAPQGAW